LKGGKKEMKKILVLLGAVMILFLISGVMASTPSFNIKLVQRNPSDWNVVNGGTGNVLLSQGNKASAIIRGMEPNTAYMLIYYGFGDKNDVWPYATCINSGVTNKHGATRIQTGIFDYKSFVGDGKNQKFWVIKSADVNCISHQMTAWNPTEYLFELKTV
jgi:hypothetical protein